MMCLAHLPRSMNSNDKVEFTYTGVLFGVFLMDLRELQIGHDGFGPSSSGCSRLLDDSPSIASIA